MTDIYLKSFRTVELSSFNFDKVEHSNRNFSNNVFPQICAFKLAVLTLKNDKEKNNKVRNINSAFFETLFLLQRNATSKNLNFSFLKCTLSFLPAIMGVDPVDKITNLVREIVTKGVTRNNSGTLRSRIPAILGSLCLVLILFFGPFLVFFLRVNFVNFLGFLDFLDFIFGLASRFHLVILLLRK